jgi:hypothetical protein
LHTPGGGRGGAPARPGLPGTGPGGPPGDAGGSFFAPRTQDGANGGSATNIAPGGGGGGGGGFAGPFSGGGGGGGAGLQSDLDTGGGDGGGGGASWVLGARLDLPDGINPGPGRVTLRYPTASTTELESSPNPALKGEAVTFTATVTPAPGSVNVPTGTVTFFDSGDPIGTVTLGFNGVATFRTRSLRFGSHDITAVYNGGPEGFLGSTSNTVTQVVERR